MNTDPTDRVDLEMGKTSIVIEEVDRGRITGMIEDHQADGISKNMIEELGITLINKIFEINVDQEINQMTHHLN